MTAIPICLSLVFLLVTLSHGAWVQEMENPGLYEGDMELTPNQIEEARTGTLRYASLRDRKRFWPKTNGNAVIPYTISQNLTTEKRFLRELKVAIEQYHKYTCIKFVKRTDEKSYIEFDNGKGCFSPLGRKCYDGSCDQHNRIQLGQGCWWRAIIMHEIGHSIGLHHEQTRPDRDDYVEIIKENVPEKMLYNFNKRPKAEINSLGTKYDYLSMMHYGWNAFGKPKKMTIKTKDSRYQYLIGQSKGFSEIDQIQINKMYRCSGNYPKVESFVMPPPGCYNIAASCPFKSHYGYCKYSLWKRFMAKNCKLSCGLCGSVSPTKEGTGPSPTGSTSCTDRVTDCQHIGKSRCTDRKARWKNYMKKSCRKFCEFC